MPDMTSTCPTCGEPMRRDPDGEIRCSLLPIGEVPLGQQLAAERARAEKAEAENVAWLARYRNVDWYVPEHYANLVLGEWNGDGHLTNEEAAHLKDILMAHARNIMSETQTRLAAKCVAYKRERDALAAHVERLRHAAQSEILLDLASAYPLDLDTRERLRQALNASPEASLDDHDKRVRDAALEEAARVAEDWVTAYALAGDSEEARRTMGAKVRWLIGGAGGEALTADRLGQNAARTGSSDSDARKTRKPPTTQRSPPASDRQTCDHKDCPRCGAYIDHERREGLQDA